jgi:hypothetical protein
MQLDLTELVPGFINSNIYWNIGYELDQERDIIYYNKVKTTVATCRAETTYIFGKN